eukprot:TRINITY_DN20942_c0_g1_i5.p1 TRINITY_DN20942_c0_g1~~TRINITY_DN20942_c0_g1_i5.p1  ORF type:complete len:161 (+),score=9.88 TRINITY_DN20942_c0_g1_i5:2-484(+)
MKQAKRRQTSSTSTSSGSRSQIPARKGGRPVVKTQRGTRMKRSPKHEYSSQGQHHRRSTSPPPPPPRSPSPPPPPPHVPTDFYPTQVMQQQSHQLIQQQHPSIPIQGLPPPPPPMPPQMPMGMQMPIPGMIPGYPPPPTQEIGRAVQQECRDRSRMPSSA